MGNRPVGQARTLSRCGAHVYTYPCLSLSIYICSMFHVQALDDVVTMMKALKASCHLAEQQTANTLQMQARLAGEKYLH